MLLPITPNPELFFTVMFNSFNEIMFSNSIATLIFALSDALNRTEEHPQ